LGQCNVGFLNIIESLLQLEWDKRKKINLQEIIIKLKNLKSVRHIPLITDFFDQEIKQAHETTRVSLMSNIE